MLLQCTNHKRFVSRDSGSKVKKTKNVANIAQSKVSEPLLTFLQYSHRNLNKTIVLNMLHVYSDNAAQKIKSSLYSSYYTQACNEWRSPSRRRSAWAPQLRTNVATVASRWRHCDDLADPAIEPQTYCTDRVGLATELIGRHNATQVCSKIILFV